jgi:hypothetical protein
MLDAAVAGEVFTSPTPDRVQVATKAVDRGAGVLHIVKNYTGDASQRFDQHIGGVVDELLHRSISLDLCGGDLSQYWKVIRQCRICSGAVELSRST